MARLLFETETCSRCCGTGEYSYCQQWGTACFKCKGSGKTLSRRGKIARAAYQAWLEAHFARPIESVQDGDSVLVDGRFRRVSEVHQSGQSGHRDATTGEMVWTPTFVFDCVVGKTVCQHGFPAGHQVVVWTPELGPAMTAWADGRKGVTIVQKEQ